MKLLISTASCGVRPVNRTAHMDRAQQYSLTEEWVNAHARVRFRFKLGLEFDALMRYATLCASDKSLTKSTHTNHPCAMQLFESDTTELTSAGTM